MKKKRMENNQEYLAYALFSVLIIVGGLYAYFNKNSLTGMVIVSGGSTASAGSQTVADPHYGAAKGTLDFTLNDNGVVIGTSIGNNYTMYFTHTSVSNVTLLKVSARNATFSGRLSSVDADSGSSRCSSSTYYTTRMYYDENNDGSEQASEADVYAVTTDDNGCFAVKLTTGINNIFG